MIVGTRQSTHVIFNLAKNISSGQKRPPKKKPKKFCPKNPKFCNFFLCFKLKIIDTGLVANISTVLYHFSDMFSLHFSVLCMKWDKNREEGQTKYNCMLYIHSKTLRKLVMVELWSSILENQFLFLFVWLYSCLILDKPWIEIIL